MMNSLKDKHNVIKIYYFIFLFAFILIPFTQAAINISFASPTPSNLTTSGKILIIGNTSVPIDEVAYSFLDLDDILGWWTFSKYNSTNVIDEVGTNHVDLNSTSSMNSSAIVCNTDRNFWGNCSLNMSVGQDYYTIPANKIPRNDFSISFWFRHNATNAQGREIIFSSFDNPSGFPYVSFETDGTLLYRYSSLMVSKNLGSTDVQDDKWHHAVITWDYGGLYNKTIFWVDGGTINTTFANNWSLGNYTLGGGKVANGHAQNTSGSYIDDFIIFNRTLNLREMYALYNGTQYKPYRETSSDKSENLVMDYTAYAVNNTGYVASSDTRRYTYGNLTSIISPYNWRQMTNPLNITATTNLVGASCSYSLDSGVTNTSMSRWWNKNFQATATLSTFELKTLDVFCNDGVSYTTDQVNFTLVKGISMYVGKNQPLCGSVIDMLTSDTEKSWNSNETTPSCTINQSLKNAAPADTITISNDNYCENMILAHYPSATGNATDRLTIQGVSDSLRSFLNGTCAPSGSAFGVQINGPSNILFQYLYIHNFSSASNSDGFNVHTNATQNSTNIVFLNSTVDYSGLQDTGSDGDGVTFHEGTSGYADWITTLHNAKSGVVDIDQANTNYSNMNIRYTKHYGITFFTLGGELHFLTNINVTDSGQCYQTDDDSVVNNLRCTNSSVDNDYAIQIANGNSTISNVNVSATNGTNSKSILVNRGNLKVYDGSLDRGVTMFNGATLELTNVSYSYLNDNIVSGTLTRKWYIGFTSNDAGATISVSNSSGVIYNGALTTLNLSQYTRNSSTWINYTYNITGSSIINPNPINYIDVSPTVDSSLNFNF